MSISRETLQAVRRVTRRVLGQLKSKPPICAVAWADQHFYLSPESSYVEGRWKTQPVQIAPLNAMGSDDLIEVYLFKGARIGYTKMLLAALLYLIEHKRRNCGLYREDDPAIKKMVDIELDPALRDCGPMRAIFPSLGKKSSGNTTDLKQFIGARLGCMGGQAAGNFRGDSLDVVIGDETDGFVSNVQGKSGKEGDPFVLMFKRTNGSPFPKRIMGSTPTIDGSSHIQRLSKRAKTHMHFHVPCPHCGGEQHLEWTSKSASYGIKWRDSNPATAHYVCRHCAEPFFYEDYLQQSKLGRWVDLADGTWTLDGLSYFSASGEPVRVRRICFHIPGYLSPTDPWSNLVERWYDQKDDPKTRQGFINTDLGRVYSEETGQQLNHNLLLERRERYPAQVPAGGLYLTSYTDVQTGTRLETTVVAHGLGEESWVLEHHVTPGDPKLPSTWDALENYLRQNWQHESGVMLSISRIGVDTGGHNWDEVISFADRFPPHQVIPCKGSSVYGDPVANYHRTTKGKNIGTWLCHIGTDSAKDTLYARYKLPRRPGPQPGYMHLPQADWCHERWAKQAVSEVKVLEQQGRRYVWHYKLRNSSDNNEALDCLAGNLAMLRLARQMFRLNLEQLAASMAARTTGQPPRSAVKRRKKAGTVTGGV
jgi:terminase, large subunit